LNRINGKEEKIHKSKIIKSIKSFNIVEDIFHKLSIFISIIFNILKKYITNENNNVTGFILFMLN